MTDKPALDAMKAVHLVQGLAAGGDSAQAPSTLADWKGHLAERFAVDEGQRAWLDSLDDEQEAVLTRELRDVIDSGGGKRLVVTMIADPARPGGMYHELRSESVESRAGEVHAEMGIIIAHCDANCRNWGWGPG
jgi:hypothetical protein